MVSAENKSPRDDARNSTLSSLRLGCFPVVSFGSFTAVLAGDMFDIVFSPKFFVKIHLLYFLKSNVYKPVLSSLSTTPMIDICREEVNDLKSY